MKNSFRILPLVIAVVIAATPFHGQQQTGTITGIVFDRDGKTPLSGATIWIDSMVIQTDGSVLIRERAVTKTQPDGRYRSGAPEGRIMITIIVNDERVMSYGDRRSEEIAVAQGRETVADFDLSKARAK